MRLQQPLLTIDWYSESVTPLNVCLNVQLFLVAFVFNCGSRYASITWISINQLRDNNIARRKRVCDRATELLSWHAGERRISFRAMWKGQKCPKEVIDYPLDVPEFVGGLSQSVNDFETVQDRSCSSGLRNRIQHHHHHHHHHHPVLESLSHVWVPILPSNLSGCNAIDLKLDIRPAATGYVRRKETRHRDALAEKSCMMEKSRDAASILMTILGTKTPPLIMHAD